MIHRLVWEGLFTSSPRHRSTELTFISNSGFYLEVVMVGSAVHTVWPLTTSCRFVGSLASDSRSY